jgi:hypothetical protein
VIPSSVEILGSSCFQECKSLSSISFESNSRLLRIGSNAFAYSSLQSIVIPSQVQSIDGSAFCGVNLLNCLSECDNPRFIFDQTFLLNVIDHRLIRNLSGLSHITIPCDIEILGSSCFASCRSLSSISFESNSRLMRIESNAFSHSSLQSIVIPSNVEILASSCFYKCESFSSISFESNSRLRRIESQACYGCHFSIVLPSTVVFVAYDAHPDLSQLSLSDPDSYPMFDRWRRLRKSGITVDFQRILRFASGLPRLKDFVFDMSGFEERSVIGQNDRVSSQVYERRIDGAVTVVKAISLSGRIDRCQIEIEIEIENLLNLRHPMITPLIGCVLPVELSGQREFKTVRLYATEGSLADVLSNPPAWWTPTAKAKAVVGIALGLRFAHGLGLLHGAVKPSNILFDADRRIQIADFSPIRLKTGTIEPFSGEEWTPTADTSAFASLLFEIAVGGTATPPIGAVGGPPFPAAVPAFVSRMIEDGRSPISARRLSFAKIVESLKENRFEIIAGVDSDEVSAFVSRVESSEQAGEIK